MISGRSAGAAVWTRSDFSRNVVRPTCPARTKKSANDRVGVSTYGMRSPKKLQGDALDFWKRNAPHCEKMGTLKPADVDTFCLLCSIHSRLVQAESNNAGSIEFVCLVKQYTNLSKLFGLDPVSRRKLQIDLEEEEADEFGLN